MVLQIMDSAMSLGASWARCGVSTSRAPGSRTKTCCREELWDTQMGLTTASTSYTSDCRIPVRDELFPALLTDSHARPNTGNLSHSKVVGVSFFPLLLCKTKHNLFPYLWLSLSAHQCVHEILGSSPHIYVTVWKCH